MVDKTPVKLPIPVNPARDHVRGAPRADAVSMVVYSDYLCPYCRRLRNVLKRLQRTLGDRLAYIFRHFPNERAHPGSEFLARAAEAAAEQGRFWEMHDWIYRQEPPVAPEKVLEHAASLRLDMERFQRDIESAKTRRRIEEDIHGGRINGVTGTPTVFIDGMRYDGAWDFHSMLESVEPSVAMRVRRSAGSFARLPVAGGLVLLIAAAAALVCANTPLAPYYRLFVDSSFGIGTPEHMLVLSTRGWFSEGLLAIFFLLVGLEIRRELTSGALAERSAAALPVVAAIGGVVAPAAIYLVLNSGPAEAGWAVPTATDIAFTLGILALFGDRISPTLRVFVAALAVVDDVLSVLTLAIFYPRGFDPAWLTASSVAIAFLFILNRWRTYAVWPYACTTLALALFLHASGVHAALAGVILAAFLPTRPAPVAATLLGQAATALAELEHAEHVSEQGGTTQVRPELQPIWEWASRNLSAASERLLSPADRIERGVAPWSTYLVLPLFAFSATGVDLHVDISSPGARMILAGVILGLVVGKPLGIALASWLAIKARIAVAPAGMTLGTFIGAACLCGVGDTVALVITEEAFPAGPEAAVAKIGVLVGSIGAAVTGALILATSSKVQAVTKVEPSAALAHGARPSHSSTSPPMG